WIEPVTTTLISRGLPVWGQKCGKRGQQLLGRLLGDPVAAAGEDYGLHVIGDEFHRVPGAFTGAFPAAHRQDGEGQPPGLALLVLRGAGGDGAVEPETAAQVIRVFEDVDVVLDGVAGQLVRPGRGVELRAKKDVLTPGDELLVHLGE